MGSRVAILKEMPAPPSNFSQSNPGIWIAFDEVTRPVTVLLGTPLHVVLTYGSFEFVFAGMAGADVAAGCARAGAAGCASAGAAEHRSAPIRR